MKAATQARAAWHRLASKNDILPSTNSAVNLPTKSENDRTKTFHEKMPIRRDTTFRRKLPSFHSIKAEIVRDEKAVVL